MTSSISKKHTKTKPNVAKNRLKNSANNPKKWGFAVNKNRIYARNKLDASARRFVLGPAFNVSLISRHLDTPIGWIPEFYIRINILGSGDSGAWVYSGSVAKKIAGELCRLNGNLGFSVATQEVIKALTSHIAKEIEICAQRPGHRLYLTKYGHPLKQSR